jgi:WD40 repeat protein/serine/threonine protein kinase
MADRDLSGRTLGEFVLVEKIGQGGYGSVYRAAQPLLKRDVVVKVLRGGDDIAEQRFFREARLASRFEHPFAAHIYAFGVDEDEDLLWIAMELVHGVTLSSWIEQHGPMALEQFVPFFECVADAVHAAHECGIVHRDLKPSNVMVVECGSRLLPKLLDFGIAKALDQSSNDAPSDHRLDDEGSPPRGADTTMQLRPASQAERRTVTSHNRSKKHHLTRSGAAFGSRPYMSPEQWNDAQAVGPASDIYALGVAAYEVLTGRLPYTADTSDEFYRLHLFAEVPKLGDGFPRDLDRVIGCALAKLPEHRYRSPLEMAAELREAMRAQPRERLRSLARVWSDSARSPVLLLRGGDLLRTPTETIGELERAFVTASHRRAMRIRRIVVALAATMVAGLVSYRAAVQARMSDRIAIESDVEQGRQALLHGESSEAVRHLEQAYQRGERSSDVAFMLARAVRPRMSELARFTSHSGRMWSAVFTPDGKRVLTTDDQSAQMWDAKSGQLLFTMNHGDTVYRAVFSGDGSRIITAGRDGTVRIWNAATGVPLRELTYRGTGAKRWRYSAVATSSHFVAAIDVIGRVAHVWDADTGTPIAELTELANDASEKASIAFSPDGRWLAATGGDDVSVFDTSTWQRVVRIAGPRVRSLGFDPAGPRLVVGTYDGVASIWDVPSGVRIRCLRDAGAAVDAVAFSGDGGLIATASRDGTEQVWDAASGSLRTQINSHRDKIYAIEFSRAGNLILSAGADGAVVVSDVSTGMPVARLEGPKGLVIAAHFDPESRRVVGASWDGTARVWDAASPYRRWDLPQVGAECDTEDSLTPDQRFVALSCRDHGTHVWDTATGEVLAELPAVTSVAGNYSSALPALTATGDRVAIARGNVVEVYALPSGQLFRTIVHPAAVNAVAFAPAGHDLVSGAIDGSLLVTRDERDPVALRTASAGIDAVAVLADGRVVVADASGRLRVIAPDRNAVLMDLATPSRIRLMRPSHDGTRLVTISTTSEQAPPVLWDLDRYRLATRLEGHVGRVFTARFVAVGGRQEILTAGADGTAQLWDAATGHPLQTFRGDSHFVVDAALAPDGSTVVAGGSDGLLRFWDTSSGRLLWKLQAHRSYVLGVHYEGDDLVTRGFAGEVARWALPSPGKVIEACHASTCAADGDGRK